jgi:Legionella pneumophila major outer membrane protein precursor
MMINKFIKIPFVLGLFLVSLSFAEGSDYNEELVSERSKMKSRNMQNDNNMDMNQERHMKQCDDLCFEPRCGCDPDYKRCCFGLPLPVKCGWAFIEGEYLYLKTYSLTPYASERVRAAPFSIGTTDATYSSNIHNVPFSGDSGYRVSLGIYFSNCSFGSARFTQYGTDGTDSFTVLNTGAGAGNLRNSLAAYWLLSPFSIGTAAESITASATNRFRMKMLDFDYNSVFTCSRYTFTPFVGVRFAWVKADLRADYVAVNSADTGDVFSEQHHVDVNHHLNLGVGLHSGMDMNVDLCWGFGLYGNSSFTALIGQKYYRIRDKFVLLDITTDFATTGALTQNYKDTDFQMNAQAGIGITWGTHFCKCCYYLGLKLGYEMHYWPNFVSYLEEYNTTSEVTTPDGLFNWRRSVFSHGLNVGLRFDF